MRDTFITLLRFVTFVNYGLNAVFIKRQYDTKFLHD